MTNKLKNITPNYENYASPDPKSNTISMLNAE